LRIALYCASDSDASDSASDAFSGIRVVDLDLAGVLVLGGREHTEVFAQVDECCALVAESELDAPNVAHVFAVALDRGVARARFEGPIIRVIRGECHSNNKLTYAYGSACIVDEDGTVGRSGGRSDASRAAYRATAASKSEM
jgi:hypothetical protein